MKHKKDLESLKMSKDEEITVYTFSVVAPKHFLEEENNQVRH